MFMGRFIVYLNQNSLRDLKKIGHQFWKLTVHHLEGCFCHETNYAFSNPLNLHLILKLIEYPMWSYFFHIFNRSKVIDENVCLFQILLN